MKSLSPRLLHCLILVALATSSFGQSVAQIGKKVYEFWPIGADPDDRFSFALLHPPTRTPPIEMPTVNPTFGFTKDSRYSARIAITKGTDLYGTGEVAGPLRRNGCVTECWNTDAFNYSEKNPSLYQSHPWVLALRKDGTAFGVLAETTYRCRVDLTNGIEFAAEGPRFPLVVIDGKNPQEVVERLSDLTGHMNLPPEWALGYHQCRWSYMSADEALGIASEFRKRHIPCDTIWFDIDYMDGFRIFTFDQNTFPNPKQLNIDLAAKGFHNVWMIDPGVKVDPNYDVYKSGKEQDAFVKTRMGYDQQGDVWPGKCVFPDFTRPQTRAWWSALYKAWLANGITGVWNDMNEPSFFNADTRTMPEVAMHRGGDDIEEGSHSEYHNVYGMLMARATFDGLKQANPDKRPFVLTRAGYIGYQRFAATWTGDNASSWTDMRNAIPMALNLGLSGQPFVGPDIPGFSADGPSDPAERMTFFSRWWGIGSMLPFCRGHAMKGTERKEPWSFGPEVEEAAREALWRRYVLMPYLYTTFHGSSQNGLPVARPLFFADPKDPRLRSEDRGFLLGGDILVAAQPQKDQRILALPKGWTPFNLAGKDASLPRLSIRPGAIVPLGPPTEFIGEKKLDHLWLVACLNEQGKAQGQLYEDAGDGYGYQAGYYALTTYDCRLVGNRLRFSSDELKGNWLKRKRQLTVVVLQDGKWLGESTAIDEGESETLILSSTPELITEHEVGPKYRADFSSDD